MIQAKSTELQAPRLERVQDLLGSKGPCITILLPPYRPGEQGKSMAALLRTDLQDLRLQLASRGADEQITQELLNPLQGLSEDDEFSGGSHLGRIIFRSREVFEQFELIAPVKAQLTLGSYFQLRPILVDLNFPKEFYVLKLSKKQVELFRCAELRAERVPLPKGVPETLEEALAFKPPDHDLENRSSAGGSTGSMRGVRFGTGSGRETQHTYVADFFRMVDRGIAELLGTGNTPLVLAGVDEDTAAYRAIHSCPNLLNPSIHGSPNGPWSEENLLQRAYLIVRTEQEDRTAESVVEWKERLAPPRFTTDLKTILRAAASGRVENLYVDQMAQRSGIVPDTRASAPWNREEDLLNVAAVQTLQHGGLAFALPPSKMVDGAALAAVLRY